MLSKKTERIKGTLKGDKVGIEIEMFPRIRYKNLHGFVNRRTESHQQTEKQRIDTVNIIKVDQLQLLPAESTKQIDSDKQREDDHEIRSMRIAEKNGLPAKCCP